MNVTYFTSGQTYDDQIALGAFDFTEDEAILLTGDPGGFLGIVRLGLIDALLLERDVKVFGRIRIGSGALGNMAGHVG